MAGGGWNEGEAAALPIRWVHNAFFQTLTQQELSRDETAQPLFSDIRRSYHSVM